MLEMPDSKQRRIYRWGTSWGIQGDKWICETRIHVSSSEDMLVEILQSQSCDVLPLEMDDIWDEEYISLGGLEYNGLVSIRGTSAAVLEIAKTHQLPTPSLPSPSAPCPCPPVSVNPIQASRHSRHFTERENPSLILRHSHKPVRTDRKCLILD